MSKVITVIVPTYNNEGKIEKCLKSIASQSYTNFEALVIDDGSTDKSGEICDRFAENDIRFKVFHIQNKGVSNARNMGIDNATGEYVTFVDADDYVHPDYLLKLIEAVENNQDCKVAVTSFYRVNENTGIFKKDNTETVFLGKCRINVFQEYDYSNTFLLRHVCGALYCRDILKNIRFRYGLYVGEDALFMAEVISKSHEIVVVSQPLYYYIYNPVSASHGSIDERKATVIDSWHRIIDVYSKHSECSPKFIAGCYISLCGEIIQAMRSLHRDNRLKKNDKVYCKFLKAIREILPTIVKLEAGIKWKISIALLAISPKLYFALGF